MSIYLSTVSARVYSRVWIPARLSMAGLLEVVLSMQISVMETPESQIVRRWRCPVLYTFLARTLANLRGEIVVYEMNLSATGSHVYLIQTHSVSTSIRCLVLYVFFISGDIACCSKNVCYLL